MSNAYGSGFVAWRDAKDGDRISADFVVVRRGIPRKMDADLIARLSGGSVWLDGAMKHAVVKQSLTTEPSGSPGELATVK